MARPLRIELGDARYHVTSCGDRGEADYSDEDDQRVWLATPGAVCREWVGQMDFDGTVLHFTGLLYDKGQAQLQAHLHHASAYTGPNSRRYVAHRADADCRRLVVGPHASAQSTLEPSVFPLPRGSPETR